MNLLKDEDLQFALLMIVICGLILYFTWTAMQLYSIYPTPLDRLYLSAQEGMMYPPETRLLSGFLVPYPPPSMVWKVRSSKLIAEKMTQQDKKQLEQLNFSPQANIILERNL